MRVSSGRPDLDTVSWTPCHVLVMHFAMSRVQGKAVREVRRPLFGRSIGLLTLGGMWVPDASAPTLRRYLFEAYSAALVVFTLTTTLGEIGGLSKIVASGGSLERKCQNTNSSLWRLLAFVVMVIFRRNARDIQDLVRAVERLSTTDHRVDGHVGERVEALQRRGRTIINKIIVGYMTLFTYSSTLVVTSPIVAWVVSGRRPHPLLFNSFWLVVGPDTPVLEMVMYVAQALSQFTSTIIVVGYLTFSAALTLTLAFQVEVAGVLFEHIPFAGSGSSLRAEREVRARVIHCINFHQALLNAATEANRVLRLMLMALLLLCLLFIAIAIYQVVVVPPKKAGLFFATFMVMMCSNSIVGGFAYGSDRLRLAAENVVTHVMASDWLEAPVSTQRLLAFTVARASRPTTLWCWRMFSVSLVTWLQLLNKSYSLFAVMRSSDSM